MQQFYPRESRSHASDAKCAPAQDLEIFESEMYVEPEDQVSREELLAQLM